MKTETYAKQLLNTCPTFSESVMVSVGVSMLESIELTFIEPGAKINAVYYCDILLARTFCQLSIP